MSSTKWEKRRDMSLKFNGNGGDGSSDVGRLDFGHNLKSIAQTFW